MVGLRPTSASLSTDKFLDISDEDWSDGFRDGFDPKFLFQIENKKVTYVYSFDLGNWNNGRGFGGSPVIRKNHRTRMTPKNPANFASLPPKLLNTDKPRRALVNRLLGEISMEVLSFAPLGSFAYMIKHMTRHTELIRQQQAAYLEAMLRQLENDPTLNRDFSNLISQKEVTRTIESLLVRFHPNEGFGGLLVNEEMRSDYAKKIKAIKKDESNLHFSRLTKIANEKGLWLYPISANHSLVAYDPESSAPLDHYKDFDLDLTSPASLPKDLLSIAERKKRLIPLGILSSSQQVSSTALVDFNASLDPSMNSRLLRVLDAGRDIGFNFIPVPLLAFGLRMAGEGVEFVMKKQGSTFFESTVQSYGELQAIMDMGLATLPIDQLLQEALTSNLDDWGFTEEEIKDIKTKLSRASPEQADDIIHGIFGAIVKKESDSSFIVNLQSTKQLKHTKEVHLLRFNNWLKRNQKRNPSSSSKNFDKSSAGTAQSASKQADQRKATILFLVDGLRPDRLLEQSQKGLMPTVRSHFIDRGLSIDAYTSRSLTLPSWATVLTGREIDEHGLRSNNPISRTEKRIQENFLDARKDLLIPDYIRKGRSYQHLESSQTSWIPMHFTEDQILLGFLPINSGNYPPIKGILNILPRSIRKITSSTFSGVEVLDQASANEIAKAIRKNPGSKNLIIIWLASIDEMSHSGSHQMNWAYKTVDSSIATVLNAAKADPILKNARTYLISDHGHLGGLEKRVAPGCAESNSSDFFINNTGFNLTKFFAGDFFQARNLNFVVGAAESPNPSHDLGYLKEFLIHPFEYTYRGHQEHQGERTLMVDYSGDNMAQIYLLKYQGREIKSPLTYGQLKNYKKDTSSGNIDFPGLMLKQKLNNLESLDKDVRACIEKVTGRHPIQLFAASLGQQSLKSIRKKLPEEHHRPWTRTPILVEALGEKKAIILTHQNQVGFDVFQYFLVKDFQQTEDGDLSFAIENEITKDPLKIITNQNEIELAQHGMIDRTWFDMNRKNNVENIAGPMGIVRSLTLAQNIAQDPKRQAEIPDFLLYANVGYSFQSSSAHQSDHGGLSRRESQITLNVSGLGSSSWKQAHSLETSVLTRDIAPTVFQNHKIRPLNSMNSALSFDRFVEAQHALDQQ